MRVGLLLPLVKSLNELRDKLNSILVELQEKLASVPEVATISGTSKDGTAGGANTITEVAHGLRAIPDFIHIEPKGSVTWWVTDEERALWTSTRVYLRFSAASVNFTGTVSRLE